MLPLLIPSERLPQDGNFWALDEQTGTTLGHVQFEPIYPSRAELLDNVDYPAHTVVADGNGIALHFMETQQLFFFHFSRSDECRSAGERTTTNWRNERILGTTADGEMNGGSQC
jgi:hypothetical protein